MDRAPPPPRSQAGDDGDDEKGEYEQRRGAEHTGADADASTRYRRYEEYVVIEDEGLVPVSTAERQRTFVPEVPQPVVVLEAPKLLVPAALLKAAEDEVRSIFRTTNWG